MRRILILAYTDLRRDPRVARQVAALREHYTIDLVTRCSGELLPGVIPLPPGKPLTRTRKVLAGLQLLVGIDGRPHVPSRRLVTGLLAGRPAPDLIIANDLEMLPLAFAVAGTTPVVFDAHEYYLEDQEPKLGYRLVVRPYLHRLCRRLLSRCAAVMTVCQGIAERYQREFAVEPVVVTNAPAHQELAPRPLADGRIRLVHHGALIGWRRPEHLIEVMKQVDRRFDLTLMLMPGKPADEARLRAAAAAQGNVAFIPPVPMPDIARTLNAGYDLGIHVLPPVTFNDRMALPNKFFEFMQARLGVVVGPSPEMARIVTNEGLGVVAPSFEPGAVAAALNALSEADVARFKSAAHASAAQHNAECNAGLIRDLVERVLTRQRPHSTPASI